MNRVEGVASAIAAAAPPRPPTREEEEEEDLQTRGGPVATLEQPGH